MHVNHLAQYLAHSMFNKCKCLLPWLVLLSKAATSTLKCRSQMTWITWFQHLIIWWGYPLRVNQDLSVYTAITSPHYKKAISPMLGIPWGHSKNGTPSEITLTNHYQHTPDSTIWTASWPKCSVDRSEFPWSSSGLWPRWQSCSLACHQELCTGTSLEVQWLRLRLPMQGVRVWSLVGELRSHMPPSQKTKT